MEKVMEKRELLDVERLRGWLCGKNPDDEYVWQDPVFCLMGRYLADHGHIWGEFAYSEMPEYEEIAGVRPWTFGSALKRLEALDRPELVGLPAPMDKPLMIEHVSAEKALA